MIRRFLTAVLVAGLVVWLAGPAQAEERRLGAAEIEGVLAGNTLEGLWSGRPYKQYFAPSGRTIYAEEGRPDSAGRWRADPEKDAYCSWWEMSGWACYEVWSDGPGHIVWVSPGSGSRAPAQVLEGDRL
jgi:hypothetical protein